MSRLLTLLIVLIAPEVVDAHGCPSFQLFGNNTDDSPLSDLLPPFVEEFVTATTSARSTASEPHFMGVHDCHVQRRGYELGLTAICSSPDECECRAYFQFQECASCSLCPEYMNGTSIGIDSFQADCSNVQDELFPNCQASCGLLTEGCFPVSQIEAGPASGSGMQIVAKTAVIGTILFHMLL